ncbi:MAG: DNA translocase FtsK, partial [Gemmiger sp.]|nr:DNA translocase FtsK [Gemmiger sp.]
NQALQNDPLKPVVIGPGGTFGLDPLEQLAHPPPPPTVAHRPEPEAAPRTGDSFEQRLDGQGDALADAAPADGEDPDITALIRKAMGEAGHTAEGGNPQSSEISAETKLDLPDGVLGAFDDLDDFMDAGDVAETPAPAYPATPPGAAPVVIPVPTLGGSFDVAEAAWNAGVPMTEVLAGNAVVVPESPARPVLPTVPAAPATRTPAMGNSASEPISSPPNAAHAKGAAAPGGDSLNLQAAMARQAEEIKPYCYPSLNLFNPQQIEDDAGAAREMKKNAGILVSTLDSFGVSTKILDICRGPSVTRYELQPQAGVKISRITNLSDDIALNLATAGVRIEAPIPGKPAVGIEVPNRLRSAVNIRGVFESPNYINMRSPLTMALGKDIAGTAQVADLCKMPHLLVAGSTGSGKSVCINSIIISFLFRSGPEDVKLILIDPKVVELAEYNGIPHLLMPVVTEPRKAAGALGASVAEMERRYKLFAENNVRDIKTYNRFAAQHPGMEHLPYIAIVIDELADLMMVAGKEVEDYICRIAQKARAAGLHLIIATQRPSVDVITGLIKANVPSRIAFAVSSQIDSRTILDGGGAEKLLGNGDMLFMPVGASKPTRIQGTFVTDEEISAVLSFIKTTSTAQYDEEMIAEMERRAVAEKRGGGSDDDADGGAGHDAMFEQAAECVIEAGLASTSLLQRRCKLGYARAARIMDQMEQEKIIGPYEGAKPRAVLVTKAQWQERKLSAQNDE